MAESKKTKKNAPESTPFVEAVWATAFDLADDARIELHKQAGSFIGFAEGVASGGFAWIAKVNDRLDALAATGLGELNALGRDVLAQTRALPQKASESARGAAERAKGSARVLVATPSKKAA
jgi:hypothetical protein